MFYRAIYLFNQDLRLTDNIALTQACQQSCFIQFAVHVPAEEPCDKYGNQRLGRHRQKFLAESYYDLQQQLQARAHPLERLSGDWLTSVSTLIDKLRADALFCSVPHGYEEKQKLLKLQQRFPALTIVSQHTDTLFTEQQLQFDADSFPLSYSKFCKFQEQVTVITESVSSPRRLPQAISENRFTPVFTEPMDSYSGFIGGASQGMANWQAYLASGCLLNYKQTRDNLDGWYQSSKLSSWLASGCLGVRQVWHQLKHYEAAAGTNQSTEWLAKELLWREYFHWYGHLMPKQVFLAGGRNNIRRSASFYPERFRKWCVGNTPWPLVNACMKQLNVSGYMSNRGRQIVASALIHELGIDWRAGAGYFQQQLIDFDIAVNWGNWQYIAGVFSNQAAKKFDLEWQTAKHDPNGEFVHVWRGREADDQLDHTDLVDWPC